MARASDPIEALEAAYDLSGDERGWMTRLVQPIAKCIGRMGMLFTFDPSSTPIVSAPVFHGLTDALRAGFVEEIYAHAHALASNEGARAAFLGKTGCATVSSLLDAAPGSSVAPILAHRAALRRLGFEDSFGIVGRNPDGTGITYGTLVNAGAALPASFLQQWTHVAAHLAAALRLRRSLERHATIDLDGESVIDPSRSRVEHAIGPAKSAPALATLRDAVRAVDRARTRRVRRADPLAATELWRGLVAGRWSLIERYDSDGRRFYVAHKNDPRAPELRALSTRERQVVAYAAQGHSNKLIGYELGLSKSTVVNHLTAAQKKLGVESRTELVRLARLLGAERAVRARADDA
jgi:DNA-binding CsgD family transcriptional regulator